MGREGEAILIAAGARGEILREAASLMEERRRLLRGYLEKAVEKAEITDYLAIIDFRDVEFNPRFSGSVSTILSRSPLFRDRVVVVVCRDVKEGFVKLSARAPRSLVDRGLDLSRIMDSLARRLGGSGGGHNVAAGATIRDSVELKQLIAAEVRAAVGGGGP
jgi:RecJ-like exonuclease